jgi:hypothetical protein
MRKPHSFSTITRLAVGAFAAFVALSIVYVSATLPNSHVSAASGNALTGYLWSDNVGWVSLSGPNYGVVINSDKSLSGYAWGDNLGWVSFNASDVGGCGAAPQYNPGSQALTGWARALNGKNSDGCISLSGSGYGAVLNNQHTYAWGSDTVGWLDFAYAGNPCPNGNGQSGQCTTCDPGYVLQGGVCYVQCPNGQGAAGSCTACNSGYVLQGGSCVLPSGSVTNTLKAVPSRIKQGGTAQTSLSWTTTGMNDCTLKRSDTGATVSTALSSAGTAASAINQNVTFTLTCHDNALTYTSTATVGLLPTFIEK